MPQGIEEIGAHLGRWLGAAATTDVLRAALIVGAGVAAHLLVRRFVSWRLRRSPQAAAVRTIATVTIYGVSGAWALRTLGIDLSVLLGAAGILTVALGFASQTSASNLISGLFLLAERPFLVGDIIKVDGTTGEVLSIDLLSVRLRSFDNLMVRIPNESMLKSKVINLTHFPIRRMDFFFTLAHEVQVEEVRALLYDVASRNPQCLVEPAPQFFFDGYGPDGVQLQFSVWTARAEFYAVRTTLLGQIKRALDAAGVEVARGRQLVRLDPPPAAPIPGP